MALTIAVAWLATGKGLLVLLFIVALARAAFDRAPADADHGAFTLYAFLTLARSFLSVAHRAV